MSAERVSTNLKIVNPEGNVVFEGVRSIYVRKTGAYAFWRSGYHKVALNDSRTQALLCTNDQNTREPELKLRTTRQVEEVTITMVADGAEPESRAKKLTVYRKGSGEEVVHYVSGYRTITRDANGRAHLTVRAEVIQSTPTIMEIVTPEPANDSTPEPANDSTPEPASTTTLA